MAKNRQLASGRVNALLLGFKENQKLCPMASTPQDDFLLRQPHKINPRLRNIFLCWLHRGGSVDIHSHFPELLGIILFVRMRRRDEMDKIY